MMILSAFTLFHVALSLVGIGAGFVVLYGLLTSKQFDRWTTVFLATTLGTSVTGFLFPFQHFMPSHGVGIVSIVFLAIAIPARYRFHLAGGWTRVYGITAVIALYLNVFVLIAQLFQKVPLLNAVAPTQSEPPFLMAQLVLLVLFAVLAIRVSIRTRNQQLRPA
jgi:hypothetical protein